MHIIIRTDASVKIGSGHIMRCLTLADALAAKGAKIVFVCRELPGNMCDFIMKKGYTVWRMPYHNGYNADVTWSRVESLIDAQETIEILKQKCEKFDWLIADHYGIEREWETAMRPYSKQVMVIDDLANREHDCDVILDQNLYTGMESRYDSLIPSECKTFLGPEYVLLRPEFIREYFKGCIKSRTGDIHNILIFFGGSDATNETKKALEAIVAINNPNICTNVVIGSSNIYKDEIKKSCREIRNCFCHCQVSNMAQLMSEADLAIGAGGTTTWERCFLGLPAITVCIADNQRELLQTVEKKHAILNLGWYKNVINKDIQNSIQYLLNNKIVVQNMSIQASDIMGNSLAKQQDVLQALMGDQYV
ncbi:UDP-2,4-diacetamido-2,4,6-trideoxy-beta-L-altropyranose hydrolase [Pelosinus baikalensis]|uniref:UDP-2,4-diacetamido-2,4, 6-trideoxy-beta-L-altropyranose hydrolase n=1 Tax=Pelosinus baikalensis TaxID=2892015 RepID=A0ABS8HLI2_9FIRM|nr:UDP-2,4-diacetamido-2,4,6-trideoxy-beta-L-altropyranose hydrolase [Pelosinus baikalensis]